MKERRYSSKRISDSAPVESSWLSRGPVKDVAQRTGLYRSTTSHTISPVTSPKASASAGMGIPLSNLRDSDRLLIDLARATETATIIVRPRQITKACRAISADAVPIPTSNAWRVWPVQPSSGPAASVVTGDRVSPGSADRVDQTDAEAMQTLVGNAPLMLRQRLQTLRFGWKVTVTSAPIGTMLVSARNADLRGPGRRCGHVSSRIAGNRQSGVE